MERNEIGSQLAQLTEAQRERALELQARIEALQADLEALLRHPATGHTSVDLQTHGIDESQAADLRSRFKAFAEDWERPEADIYDEPPAR
jgi:hypothetical protein